MEANQESLLSTSNSSFSTRDSVLLSSNLGLQTQKASNHLRKPMIFLHPKLLLTAAQREDAEGSKTPWSGSLNAAVSSANSLCWGSSTALRESSESFTAREGSSQALSELDQCKGDPNFFHSNHSFSCIESSECYESGAETTTRINMNGKRSRSSKSKEVDSWANSRRIFNVHRGVTAKNMEALDCQGSDTLDINTEPTDNKVGIHHNVSTESMVASQHKKPLENRAVSGRRASSKKLEALDLLIYAAIQIGFLDDEGDQGCDVSLRHPKRTDRASNVCHDGYRNGFPVHLSSPILKKRVVRRARSAFFKQTGSNMLQRLGITSPTKNLEKKLINAQQKVNITIQKNDNPVNRLKADSTQLESKAVLCIQRNTSKVSSERIPACKSDVSEMPAMKNGDMSKHGGLQASPTEASHPCNTYLKGAQVEKRQCKTLMQQHKLQGLCMPELCKSLLKPLESAAKSEMCEDLCQVEYAKGETKIILEEESREAISEVEAQQQANNGGSLIRLKIRPMRLPSQVLEEADMLEGCEHATESETITRRSKRLHGREHERRVNVTKQPCDSIGSLDTPATDVDLLNRSKQARSQVLPTKFSDSVLQPWKRAYKRR